MGLLKRYELRVAEREALLRAELTRFVEVCKKHDVRAVYVFGSLATGNVGPSSDLDLLIVRETSLPFRDRGDDLRMEAGPRVQLDLIVVTPTEFDSILPSNSFGQTILSTAQRIYAA